MASGADVLTFTIQSVGISVCGVTFGDNKGSLHVDVHWAKQFVVGIKVSIAGFKIQWYEGEIHIHATASEGARIYMHASDLRGKICTMEAFAGLGGWSQVL